MTSRRRRPGTGGAHPTSSRFIVVTGVSGSGKSQAIRALEDLGYFCVDNLPTTLLPIFAELTLRADSEIPKAAVVVDVRERALLGRFPSVYRRLQGVAGLNPRLIFLDATDQALVRRFSETRRPHPLAPTRSALEGIREERVRLRPIRRMADLVLDTSDMTVHELRRAFMNMLEDAPGAKGPVVTFLSFGFKHGLPLESDVVFDVRFLPNPHFIPALRARSGRDAAVVRFLRATPDTADFLARVTPLLRFLLPRYAAEGKSYVTIAVGCTGGKHRSVYIAEALKKTLRGVTGVRLRVKHRDIANE